MRSGYLYLLLFFINCLNTRESEGQDPLPPIRLMFYNVENAFDNKDDTLVDDNVFTPEGTLRWTTSRYEKKINSIYKVIAASGNWEAPEIVGFCEIEKRDVLEDLAYGTNLSKSGYRIIHEDSPDRRGIDVCLMYRDRSVKLIYYRYFVPAQTREPFTSRSVLYAKFFTGIDTLHLFLNHWPSRKGGVLAGNEMRQSVSGMLREKIDSIQRTTLLKGKIIIAGDFNCNPEDKLLVFPGMVNLAGAYNGKIKGTYKYRGNWEMIDQILVSGSLLNGRSGYNAGNDSFSVVSQEFLLIADPKYPGFMPFATFRGYRYQGGFSDHLPVLLTLKLNEGKQE